MDSVRCQGQEATQRILDSIVLFTPEYNRTFIVVSFLTYHPSSRSQWVPQRYELSFELDERPGVRWEFRCDDIAGQCLPCDPTPDIWIPECWLAWSHRWPNYYQDTWVDLQMCKVSRILQCLPSPRWTNLHCETIRCLRITSLEIHPILIRYTHTKKYIFHVIYIII